MGESRGDSMHVKGVEDEKRRGEGGGEKWRRGKVGG